MDLRQLRYFVGIVQAGSRQLTDAFDARDLRCTQDATPVRNRPFTSKRD